MPGAGTHSTESGGRHLARLVSNQLVGKPWSRVSINAPAMAVNWKRPLAFTAAHH